MLRKKILLIVAAAVLGFASSQFVVGWYTTIPWIIAALIVGYTSTGRRRAIINGAIFGYVLFLSYMPSVYRGATDTKSILLFIGFVLMFSLVGGVAGAVGGFIGNWITTMIQDKNRRVND